MKLHAPAYVPVRIRGCNLAMTHQSLSAMLGVRRAGVTEAMHVLEGRKLIQARRDITLSASSTGRASKGSPQAPTADQKQNTAD